jgi:hypothetical protein
MKTKLWHLPWCQCFECFGVSLESVLEAEKAVLPVPEPVPDPVPESVPDDDVPDLFADMFADKPTDRNARTFTTDKGLVVTSLLTDDEARRLAITTKFGKTIAQKACTPNILAWFHKLAIDVAGPQAGTYKVPPRMMTRKPRRR